MHNKQICAENPFLMGTNDARCACVGAGGGWGGKVGRRNHLVRGALSFTHEFFLRDKTKGKTTHKFLKVSEASFNAQGRAATERATKSQGCFVSIDLNHIINTRGKKVINIWWEISLTVLLVNVMTSPVEFSTIEFCAKQV